MAQGFCTEPTMPMPVDGAVATADQMRAAMADARNFIAQSELYQACLTREAEAEKAQAAAGGQSLDPVIETGIHTKVDASKKAQERVGNMANNAMAAFKNAHPN
jgi:hypothetical protein